MAAAGRRRPVGHQCVVAAHRPATAGGAQRSCGRCEHYGGPSAPTTRPDGCMLCGRWRARRTRCRRASRARWTTRSGRPRERGAARRADGSVPGSTQARSARGGRRPPRPVPGAGHAGGLDTPVATAAHERLLLGAIDDPWMQIAGLQDPTELQDISPASPRALSASPIGRPRTRGVHQQRGERRCRLKRAPEIETVVRTVAEPAGDSGGTPCTDRAREAADGCGGAWWRAAALEGLAAGPARTAVRARVVREQPRRLLALADSPSPTVRTGALDLLAIAGVGEDAAARESLLRAETAAPPGTADEGKRADAIRLLALDAATDRTTLASLVDPQEPESVQVAAVRALGRRPGRAIGTLPDRSLGALHAGQCAPRRPTLLADDARSWMLIDALKAAHRPALEPRLRPETSDHHERRRCDPNGGTRAARGRPTPARTDRAALCGGARHGGRCRARRTGVSESLRGSATPSAARAAISGPISGPCAIGRRSCCLATSCCPASRSRRSTRRTSSSARPARPSRECSRAQTPTSITLRQGSAQPITIPRAEIRKITVSPQSSMPADLDKLVTPEEMADLLAFLRR